MLTWLVSVAIEVAGCYKSQAATSELEIGVRGDAGGFDRLADGDFVPVVVGPAGLDLTPIALRSPDLEIAGTDDDAITITASVSNWVIGADGPEEGFIPEFDGTGYVVWDIRVRWQAEGCCFLCTDVRLDAVFDHPWLATRLQSSVTIVPERDGCPNEQYCCLTDDRCLDPLITQLCDE